MAVKAGGDNETGSRARLFHFLAFFERFSQLRIWYFDFIIWIQGLVPLLVAPS